jgi:hypothetical protein
MDSLRPEAGSQSGTKTDRPTFILVPDTDIERDTECPYNCRSPYLCSRCREAARSEALLWLHGLADDHFGSDMFAAMAAGQPTTDLHVLWRDPHGVVRVGDDGPRR